MLPGGSRIVCMICMIKDIFPGLDLYYTDTSCSTSHNGSIGPRLSRLSRLSDLSDLPDLMCGMCSMCAIICPMCALLPGVKGLSGRVDFVPRPKR